MAKETERLKLIIAGGGTGGHLFPGMAVYGELQGMVSSLEVLFVGVKGGVEERVFSDRRVNNVLFPGGGLRGKTILGSIRNVSAILRAFLSAIRLVRSYDPDIVLGTGGYASAAVVAAAVLCGKPRIIQEQNSMPGLANRLLGRFADLIFLSYDEARAHFPGRDAMVLGNPIRFDPSSVDKRGAAKSLSLSPELPVVAVVGGSHGARSLNDCGMEAAAEILKERKVQFVFVAGERDYQRVRSASHSFQPWIKVLPFVKDLDHIYAVADIAVARAGASTVFELAAFGVPSVFVPYPYAADDHQTTNVSELERSGAAVIVRDEELSGELLKRHIVSLLDDASRRELMSSEMQRWARPDAARAVAREIVDFVKKTL